MNDPAIVALGVSKRFDDVVALDHCDLEVPRGAVVTLLGPSGSGKSTMLRMLAGFDHPDSGTVDIRGVRVVGGQDFVPPEERRVGVVLQDYALFPHLDVDRNVGYGLGKGPERATRIAQALTLVGLDGMDGRYPHELSGGQQQRVALARALAPDPDVVILDEPFSNLDDTLRVRLRAEVLGILRHSGATVLFITHDQEEALSISDRVAVMRSGRVVQIASPRDLYWDPVDEWVGSFVGDANFLAGVARGGGVSTPLGVLPGSGEGAVRVMIRPEAISLKVDAEGPATVIAHEFFGHDQLVTARLDDGTTLRSRLGPDVELSPGDRVGVEVGRVATFPMI